MLTLVSGGSASGKSEFAESLVVNSGCENPLVIWRRCSRMTRSVTGALPATAKCARKKTLKHWRSPMLYSSWS